MQISLHMALLYVTKAIIGSFRLMSSISFSQDGFRMSYSVLNLISNGGRSPDCDMRDEDRLEV